MEKLNSIELICKKAKDASYKLATSSNKERNIALKLGLKMKISDVEFQADGKKAIFF